MADFFSKIDSIIDEQKKAQQAQQTTDQENRELFEQISARLAPILESYVQELKARSFKVTFSASHSSVWIELKYGNGGRRALSLQIEQETGQFGFYEYFPDKSGKEVKATTGSSYNRATWKDEFFKQRLEKVIEDFITFAPLHGGI